MLFMNIAQVFEEVWHERLIHNAYSSQSAMTVKRVIVYNQHDYRASIAMIVRNHLLSAT